MLDWTRAVPPAGVFALLSLADHLGLDTAPMLHRAGLPERAAINGDTPITGVNEVGLLRALQSTAPQRDDLGLIDPGSGHFAHGGIMSVMLISAANLLQAIELNQRYLALSSAMLEFDVAVEGDWLTVTWSEVGLPADVAPFYLQRNVAMLARNVRSLGYTGPIPTSFTFPVPRDPEQLEHYEELLGVRPQFGARVGRSRVPIAVARAGYRGASPQLVGILSAEADRKLAEHQAAAGKSSHVKALIRSALPERISLEEAAQTMTVAPRTLRRQLVSEGTSFRELLDQVRADLAVEGLTLREIPVSQLADELGFGNSSAFNSAFQRWYACSPTQYRALAAAGNAPTRSADAAADESLV